MQKTQRMIPEYLTFAEDIRIALEDFLSHHNFTQVGVVVDEHTEKHCLPLLALPDETKIFRVKAGEKHKNLESCQQLWEAMTRAKFDRGSLLLNLGGGVIGDMGGFCAATYQRGIAFAQVPTTLLSQVDASIGGKLGIDFQGYKNHIGLFQLPQQVFVSTQFYETLPVRELHSGWIELLKHGLIGDARLWEKAFAKDPKTISLSLLQQAIAVKGRIAHEDPREKGIRKTLNFGHTIGHAVESFMLESKSPWLHGEAIAFGIVAAAYLSTKMSDLSQEDLRKITDTMRPYIPEHTWSANEIATISKRTLLDKKNRGGIIQMVLLETIGKAVFDIPVQPQDIKEAIAIAQEMLNNISV